MSEADAPRTLGRGGKEHLRGRGMRVFLEKVVLHLPGIVNAQAVRQLDLIQRVLKETQLGAWLPGARQLMLIEDPEFHGRSFTGPALRGAAPQRGRAILRVAAPPLTKAAHRCPETASVAPAVPRSTGHAYGRLAVRRNGECPPTG